MALSALALLTWHHLEVAHPVFAVLEQNLIVLASLAAAGVAVYAGGIAHTVVVAEETGASGRKMACFVARMFLQAASQFNQVSWLVITCLR